MGVSRKRVLQKSKFLTTQDRYVIFLGKRLPKKNDKF